jgi:hypothetical protein
MRATAGRGMTARAARHVGPVLCTVLLTALTMCVSASAVWASAAGAAPRTEVGDHCTGTDHPPFSRQYEGDGRSFALLAAATDDAPGTELSATLDGNGQSVTEKATTDDAGKVFFSFGIFSFGTYTYTLFGTDGTPALTGEHVVDAGEVDCDPSQLTAVPPPPPPPSSSSSSSSSSSTGSSSSTTSSSTVDRGDSDSNTLWIVLLVVGLVILVAGGFLWFGDRDDHDEPDEPPLVDGGDVAIPVSYDDPHDVAVPTCDWSAYFEGEGGARTTLREARGHECCFYVFRITTTVEDGSPAQRSEQTIWNGYDELEGGYVSSTLRRERIASGFAGNGPGVHVSAEIDSRPAGSFRTRHPDDPREMGPHDARDEVAAAKGQRPPLRPPTREERGKHHSRAAHDMGYVYAPSRRRELSASADVTERTQISITLTQGCPPSPTTHHYQASGRSTLQFMGTGSCGHADKEDDITCDNEFTGTTPVAWSQVTGALDYRLAAVPKGGSTSAGGGGLTFDTEGPSVKAELSTSVGPVDASAGSVTMKYTLPGDHNPPPSTVRWQGASDKTIDGLSFDLTARNKIDTTASAVMAESWNESHGLGLGEYVDIWHLLTIDGSTNLEQHASNHARAACCDGGDCACAPRFHLRVGNEAPDVEHPERMGQSSDPADLADGLLVVDAKQFLLQRPAMEPPATQKVRDTVRSWQIRS